MNKTSYFALWAGLFILCAGLGFIPEPQGALKWLLVALSVGFFVPPFLLVDRAGKENDRMALELTRNLAAVSLLLTVAAIIANFFTVMGSDALGNALYAVLVIVSTPMICGQYWVLSLFLWACLLYFAMDKLKKRK